jgi:transcriptional regulator with XRE-family HTH domain
MLKKSEIEEFYKDVGKIDLKFPVAAIAKALGESKSVVSRILNKKLEPSESFLNRFYDKFPKSDKKVAHETNLEEGLAGLREWQAGVDAGFAVLIQEIAPILAKANGRSISSVVSQLKKDIDHETLNRLALLKKEG